MKNVVYWYVMACGSCKNQCFKRNYSLHHQGEEFSDLGATLAVTTN
jgi:hypothetical protein